MSDGFDILCRTVDGTQHYAYRYRFAFKPCLPRKILDAQRFLKSDQRYEDIETLADKLKWLRHQKGMMQKEEAEAIGAILLPRQWPSWDRPCYFNQNGTHSASFWHFFATPHPFYVER